MGPELWVVSSVISSPFHHAQLNNMNNSTAGLRIMLPFIVIGVKRHNCLGVSSRFSQELKKDALYFGSSKWANTLLFSSWNTLPLTKIAFSIEGKLLEKDYSKAVSAVPFQLALFFWPAAASSFLPNQMKATLPDLSDHVLLWPVLLWRVLCAPVRRVSLLFALIPLPESFHSSLHVVPQPRMTSALFPLFPEPQHKVQLKSNLHKASLCNCGPFCTCSELLSH